MVQVLAVNMIAPGFAVSVGRNPRHVHDFLLSSSGSKHQSAPHCERRRKEHAKQKDLGWFLFPGFRLLECSRMEDCREVTPHVSRKQHFGMPLKLNFNVFCVSAMWHGWYSFEVQSRYANRVVFYWCILHRIGYTFTYQTAVFKFRCDGHHFVFSPSRRARGQLRKSATHRSGFYTYTPSACSAATCSPAQSQRRLSRMCGDKRTFL